MENELHIGDTVWYIANGEYKELTVKSFTRGKFATRYDLSDGSYVSSKSLNKKHLKRANMYIYATDLEEGIEMYNEAVLAWKVSLQNEIQQAEDYFIN